MRMADSAGATCVVPPMEPAKIPFVKLELAVLY